jgi:hypothetical protein
MMSNIHIPKIDYGYSPFAANHDYACPICREEKAVLNLSAKPHDRFEPCWKCQNIGYRTIKASGLKLKLIDWLCNE